ncbi:hypothetical protein ACOBV9_18860 (plasmid) [Pseudoalteromonas espejiana]
MRAPLGKRFLAAKLAQDYSSYLEPQKEYLIVQFKTQFIAATPSIETLTLSKRKIVALWAILLNKRVS